MLPAHRYQHQYAQEPNEYPGQSAGCQRVIVDEKVRQHHGADGHQGHQEAGLGAADACFSPGNQGERDEISRYRQ